MGVEVALNEPNAQVLIQQEVKAEKLEDIGSIPRVDLFTRTQESVNDDVFDARDHHLFNIVVVLGVVLVKVGLELVVTQNVAQLVCRVVVTLDLQAVVGQVHEVVLRLCVVFTGARPQVAGLVKVYSKVLRDHRPHSYIELAAPKEKRLLDILLDDPGLGLRITAEDVVVDISDIPVHLDAFPLVIVRRFH